MVFATFLIFKGWFTFDLKISSSIYGSMKVSPFKLGARRSKGGRYALMNTKGVGKKKKKKWKYTGKEGKHSPILTQKNQAEKDE